MWHYRMYKILLTKGEKTHNNNNNMMLLSCWMSPWQLRQNWGEICMHFLNPLFTIGYKVPLQETFLNPIWKHISFPRHLSNFIQSLRINSIYCSSKSLRIKKEKEEKILFKEYKSKCKNVYKKGKSKTKK